MKGDFSSSMELKLGVNVLFFPDLFPFPLKLYSITLIYRILKNLVFFSLKLSLSCQKQKIIWFGFIKILSELFTLQLFFSNESYNNHS